MEVLLASGVGALSGTGIYLLLRARAFDALLGLTLLSYAVNLMLFLASRSRGGEPPILNPALPGSLAVYADPLPQALVLTAIVIGFAMSALLVVIIIRMRAETGTDHVDGVEPYEPMGDGAYGDADGAGNGDPLIESGETLIAGEAGGRTDG